MSTWISLLLIPLLTIALSGVVSSYVTHRLSATRAERDFRFRKLEEMLLALDRFVDGYTAVALGHASALSAQTPAERENAIEQARNQADRAELQKVEMLVKIYFPRLRPSFVELFHHWQRMTTLLAAGLGQAIRGFGSVEAMKQGNASVVTLLRLSRQLKEAAFEEGAALREEGGLLGSIREFVRDQIG